jgi:integrase
MGFSEAPGRALLGRGRLWSEGEDRRLLSSPREASLKDLHFHDLRGTAVTRLALSNCSVPEIASNTGHSMKTVQEILDTRRADMTQDFLA